jgi:hypothetical protein
MTTTTASIPVPPTAREQGSLRVLVGAMIPASTRYEVPGADDEAIFADIVRSLGRDTQVVRRAIAVLDDLAGGSLADCRAQARDDAIARFRSEHLALATTLVAVTTRCYYRDDRVMRSIGMELRPPYPKGFDVQQGDWSLLDPVRQRGPIWRQA